MKIWIHRSYRGRQATTMQSYGFGQSYGRQRLMPREVALRRTAARWTAQHRQHMWLKSHAQQALDALRAYTDTR